jgi:hypothetical protein
VPVQLRAQSRYAKSIQVLFFGAVECNSLHDGALSVLELTRWRSGVRVPASLPLLHGSVPFPPVFLFFSVSPSAGFTDKLVYAPPRTLAGIERLGILPARQIETDPQSIAGEFVDPGQGAAIKPLAGQRVLVMKDSQEHVPSTFYNEVVKVGRSIAQASGDGDAVAKWSQRSPC